MPPQRHDVSSTPLQAGYEDNSEALKNPAVPNNQHCWGVKIDRFRKDDKIIKVCSKKIQKILSQRLEQSLLFLSFVFHLSEREEEEVKKVFETRWVDFGVTDKTKEGRLIYQRTFFFLLFSLFLFFRLIVFEFFYPPPLTIRLFIRPHFQDDA